MHDNVTAMPPPAPAELKKRTITLTHRAPIQIVEDDWPVIAQAMHGYTVPWGEEGWTIEMRVRRHVRLGDCIIHAKYVTSSDDGGDDQTVRVGHKISQSEVVNDLWKHMLAVGEELRSRIVCEFHHKYVVHAVDACFAGLPPLRH